MTIETFLAWKAKFDAEMTEIKRQKGQLVKKAKGMTGKLNDINTSNYMYH